MNHKFLLIIALAALTLSACRQTGEQQSVLRVAVISDIHFGATKGEGSMVKVPRALKNILSHKPIDALIVPGDLTDNGRPEQWDMLLSVFKNPSVIPQDLPVYVMMGNHEYYNGLSKDSSQMLYTKTLGQPFHQYVVIKGYPFITISQDNGSVGRDASEYTDEAKSFLAAHLEQAANECAGKPVFIFFHKPPAGTVVNSAPYGTDAFNSVLEHYPNAVVIAGHLHYPLGDPRSIHQDKFTSIQEGSTNYAEIEKGIFPKTTLPPAYENITEGLILNFLADGTVEIQRWDTYRNEEIKPAWLLKAPFDGSTFAYRNQTGLPAPEFAADVKPLVKTLGADSCQVTYRQASDNEVVEYYEINLWEGGDIVASTRQFSQYYLNSAMPTTLSAGFKLHQGRTYRVQIFAVDSYGNRSKPIWSEAATAK